MRSKPHYTHKIGNRKFAGKENCCDLGKGGGERMPKRKRQPTHKDGGKEPGTAHPLLASTPPDAEVEGDGVIEPRSTDVLFGRGDNINR